MKLIYNMIATLVFLSFSLLSCNKDTTKPNKEASEYFPNKVGNYWEYDVYDSSKARGFPYSNYPRHYTVKINISGIKKLVDGNDASIWQYEYPWGNDTNYVRIVSDTVKIYDKFRIETVRGLQFPLQIYLIPFQDGNRWDGKLLVNDNYTVAGVAVVNTSWNTFKECFMIYHHYEGPNIEYNDKYWFKPNIGLLKKYKNQYNLAPLNIELWQIKKYYLQ